MCIRHTPQHIAIATLYLALNSYGVELPVGEKEWWKVRVRLPERNYRTLDWNCRALFNIRNILVLYPKSALSP